MDAKKNTKILLNGAGGRMGTIVIEEIEKCPDTTLAVAIEITGHPIIREKPFFMGCDAVFDYLKERDVPPLTTVADVVIDFSTRQSSINLLREARLPSVIGVTGFRDKELDEIRKISKTVPIVQDYNFSTGVCIMTVVAEMIAQKLGVGYDVEISEIHHGGKIDAPSGTAIKLAKAVAKGRNQDYEKVVRMSREGEIGARPVGEIGIQALRLKGVVGEHTVHFGGLNERLKLTHEAGSRAVFAQGAVMAAQWVVDKPPGLYTLKDVLGL